MDAASKAGRAQTDAVISSRVRRYRSVALLLLIIVLVVFFGRYQKAYVHSQVQKQQAAILKSGWDMSGFGYTAIPGSSKPVQVQSFYFTLSPANAAPVRLFVHGQWHDCATRNGSAFTCPVGGLPLMHGALDDLKIVPHYTKAKGASAIASGQLDGVTTLSKR